MLRLLHLRCDSEISYLREQLRLAHARIDALTEAVSASGGSPTVIFPRENPVTERSPGWFDIKKSKPIPKENTQ